MKKIAALLMLSALMANAYAKGGVCTVAELSTDPKKVKWNCEHIEDGPVTIREIFDRKFIIRAIGPKGDYLIIEK